MPTTTPPSPTKQTHTTPSPWESRLGYHRAIRRGPFIFVSGTTALRPVTSSSTSTSSPTTTATTNQYELHAPNNAYQQTLAAFAESLLAVQSLGGTIADVVRVRMYVARQEDVEEVGRGFSEVFGAARPRGTDGEDDGIAVAATMVMLGTEGGGGFVDPEMLVEVEVDAVVL